jgi:hypothetical protein
MDTNHPSRRGKTLVAAALVAAALSVGATITATTAIDLHNEPTQAQAANPRLDGRYGYVDDGGFFY